MTAFIRQMYNRNRQPETRGAIYSAVVKFPPKLERRLSRVVLGVMMLGATLVAEKALDKLARKEPAAVKATEPPMGADESHGAEIRHLNPRHAPASRSPSPR